LETELWKMLITAQMSPTRMSTPKIPPKLLFIMASWFLPLCYHVSRTPLLAALGAAARTGAIQRQA
jgi:hypothetical protein